MYIVFKNNPFVYIVVETTRAHDGDCQQRIIYRYCHTRVGYAKTRMSHSYNTNIAYIYIYYTHENRTQKKKLSV